GEHGRTVPAHQNGRLVRDALRECRSEGGIADQQVRHAGSVANLEYRYAERDEGGPVVHRLERNVDYPERNKRRGAAVADRHDIRTYFVDLAVEEPFGIKTVAAVVDCIVVEIELQDVAGSDEFRRQRPRQEVSTGVLIVSNADMTPPVEHAFPR